MPAPLFVGVLDTVIVSVLLYNPVTLVELEIELVLVAVIVLDDVGDPVSLFVIIGVPVIVCVPKPEIVFFIDLEEVDDIDDVLLEELDLVLVGVFMIVFDTKAVNVGDLLIVVVLEEVVVELIVLELETDLLTELELVPVFVAVTEPVAVDVIFILPVLIEVADIDAELDEVFEPCVDLLYDGELEDVFEIGADRVLVGLAEFVFDVRPDDVPVLEAVEVFVAVVVLVNVLVIIADSDI
jgi:hypothetical protein